MLISEKLKAGLIGATIGAVALAVVGFSWGGWTTAATARERSASAAQREVVAAMVPMCLERAQQDPQAVQTLAELRDSPAFERRNKLMATGWATMPGAESPDRALAVACLEQLASRF
jgi:pimeloyl-ACP methyl ester carboxylesterase